MQFLLGSSGPVRQRPPDHQPFEILLGPDPSAAGLRHLALRQALPDARAQIACLPDVEPLVTGMVGQLDLVCARPVRGALGSPVQTALNDAVHG